MRSALRVPGFRGVQVAAGVVAGVLLAAVLDARLGWPRGVHLAYLSAATAAVAALAAGARASRVRPPAWASVLAVACVALAALALARIGSAPVASSGAVAWRLAVVAALAAALAAIRGVATCTLLAGLAGGGAVVAGLDALVGLHASGLRWLLLAEAIGFTLATVARRDRRPDHAAQLATCAGAAVTALAVVLLAGTGVAEFLVGNGGAVGGDPSTWWELVLLAIALGGLAYGLVDEARASVGLGALNLALWAALVGLSGHGVLGWPLVLAAGALAFLAVGLRPTTPAPPSPDDRGADPPPPLDVLRRPR